jgi:nitrile hydratase
VLLKKSVVTEKALSAVIDKLDSAGCVLSGAELVVRAWLDPDFKKRLLDNGMYALQYIPTLSKLV